MKKRILPILVFTTLASSFTAFGETTNSTIQGKIPHLLNLLHSKNQNLRQIAAMILAEKGYKQALPVLIEMLKDTNPDIRLAAVNEIEKIGDEKAILPLIKAAFKDNKKEIRSTALEALEKIVKKEGKKTVPFFIEALKSENWKVRLYSALMLGRLKSKKAVPILKKIVKKDKNPNVKTAARLALKMITQSK